MDSLLNNYILFWVCILGLCLGSFYNVVILRSLSGESIIFPPSKCPDCGKQLKPWHNIPVLSYIFLRGKCAFCKKKISLQYPIIELTTMILFAASYLKFGLSISTVFAIILCSSLLIMTVTDLKEKLVDCNIAIGLGIVGLAFNHNLDSLLGLITGVLVLEVVARLGYLLKKGRATGEADTYLAGALGACFGLSNIMFIFIYSLAASMIFIVPAFLYNHYKKGDKALCILFILFILSALIFKTVVQNYLTFILLAGIGITLCIIILRSLKKEQNPVYLPLFPAFFIGTLFYLFYYME